MGQAITRNIFTPHHYKPAPKTGPSEFTESGQPQPKLQRPTDRPGHLSTNRMSLQLHMNEVRSRARMTPAEREWRKKYVLDQHLHPDEPIRVDASHRQLNPIRRFYRWPWDKIFEKVLEPRLGFYWATLVRQGVPKMFFVYGGICLFWYHMKYEAAHWTRHIEHSYTPFKTVLPNRKEIESEHPGLLDKGLWTPKTPDDYNKDSRFHQRLAELKLDPSIRPW